MTSPINNRYEFVYLFDCADGNPNGDPDAANAPRLDPETMQGLVSDVCTKRKIRNFVQVTMGETPGYNVHVRHGAVLNHNIEQACNDTGVKVRTDEKNDKEKPKNRPKGEIATLQTKLCQTYFDIRTFGAVLSTGPNAGQLRGPVQVSFSRSIDRVFPVDMSITRVCGTEAEKATEMGRKNFIPYGLFRCHGFISANLARQTGFNADDLAVLFKALCGRSEPNGDFGPNMFDSDTSAARTKMAAQALTVFKHEAPLGNAPAHQLFNRVKVARKAGIDSARKFEDYELLVEESDLPRGVTLIRLL